MLRSAQSRTPSVLLDGCPADLPSRDSLAVFDDVPACHTWAHPVEFPIRYPFAKPEPIGYNPSFPIETFDIIVTDEAHRSIYNLWRQVLEYFDAYLIGLTATPSKKTFGFFNQNLVMEYGHQQAVADGVKVNYGMYRIRTQVRESYPDCSNHFNFERLAYGA